MKLPTWVINLLFKILGGNKIMDKIKAYLSGKKTYIVSVGMVITALVKYLGDNDLGALVNSIAEAFAFSTVRAAIAKK